MVPRANAIDLGLCEGCRSLAGFRDDWRECKILYFTAETLLTPVDPHQDFTPMGKKINFWKAACWARWASLRSGLGCRLRVMTT